MARGRIAGITIEINGDTSGLSKSLKTVDSSLNATQKALKDVNKLLKFNPGNTELLTQKQRNLKKAVEDTKLRLKQLKEAAKKVTPESIGQEKYDALQREIIETESKLKNLTKEMRNFGSVGAQKIALVGEKLKTVGSKMSSIGKTMTATVTLPIAAGFAKAASSASDYEENLNKIDVAFGKYAGSVNAWASTATKQFGLSVVAATSAASSFGALGKGIGLTEKDAAAMSTTLAGLSADLASYFNTSTDDSAKALEGIFTGESEALKKFGVVMNDTNLKQFAEDQGLVWKEMSQAEKVQLRYNYVLAKTADAQGDYARTADGTANSIKTFKAACENLAVAIGQQLLPIITPIIQKITEIINKFNTLSPQTQKIITIIGLVVAAIGPLLVVLGTLFSAIGSIMTVWPMLVGAIGAIGAPVAIAVGVIAGLIAVGVLLYKNWDKIIAWAKKMKENVIKTMTALKQKVTDALNRIINAFNNLKAKIANIVSSIKTNISNTFTAIKASVSAIISSIKANISNTFTAIKTKVSNVMTAIKTAISNKLTAAKTAVSNIVASIKTIMSFSGLKDKVSNLFSSIKNTISDKMTAAKNAVTGLVDKVKSVFPISLGRIFSGVQLPHFKISGGKVPWGIGGKGTAPSVSVEWYRKAMQRPYMLDGATIFGAMGGKLLGGGESGKEVILGYDAYKRMAGGVTINMTVNAAQGMNETALANMVARKINKQVKELYQVW
jgi:phage-related minor tail protein